MSKVVEGYRESLAYLLTQIPSQLPPREQIKRVNAAMDYSSRRIIKEYGLRRKLAYVGPCWLVFKEKVKLDDKRVERDVLPLVKRYFPNSSLSLIPAGRILTLDVSGERVDGRLRDPLLLVDVPLGEADVPPELRKAFSSPDGLKGQLFIFNRKLLCSTLFNFHPLYAERSVYRKHVGCFDELVYKLWGVKL
jgi:hypothetical protein